MLNPTEGFVDDVGKLNMSPIYVYQAIFGDVIRNSQAETLNKLLREAGILYWNGKRGRGSVWYLTVSELPKVGSGSKPTLSELIREQMEAAQEASAEGNEAGARVHRAAATALAGLTDLSEIDSLRELFEVIVQYL